MKEARLFTLFQRLAKWYLAPKLATCQWFSIGTAVCSTNKTDPHDIAEMLLKVALNTITLTLTKNIAIFSLYCGLYFKDNIPYNDYFETAWVCYTLYLLNLQ